MTTVVRSEKGIYLEGAAQQKITKAEESEIRAEVMEGVPVTKEADRQPQLRQDPQEGAKGHNLEMNFLNVIEK